MRITTLTLAAALATGSAWAQTTPGADGPGGKPTDGSEPRSSSRETGDKIRGAKVPDVENDAGSTGAGKSGVSMGSGSPEGAKATGGTTGGRPE